MIVRPDYRAEDFECLSQTVEELEIFQPVFTVLTPLPATTLYESAKDTLISHDWSISTDSIAFSRPSCPGASFTPDLPSYTGEPIVADIHLRQRMDYLGSRIWPAISRTWSNEWTGLYHSEKEQEIVYGPRCAAFRILVIPIRFLRSFRIMDWLPSLQFFVQKDMRQ